jgi:hypothetical protein
MLPNETPWVLYEGSGNRGPFSLVVSGTAISYADKAHIRVTRFAADGTNTTLVEGTDYQLSANSALPDLNDPQRPVTTATCTLKAVQPVLAAGQHLLIERIAPAEQDLAYTAAGGFSSRTAERNLDAIMRVVQQINTSVSRGIISNRLDATLMIAPIASSLGMRTAIQTSHPSLTLHLSGSSVLALRAHRPALMEICISTALTVMCTGRRQAVRGDHRRRTSKARRALPAQRELPDLRVRPAHKALLAIRGRKARRETPARRARPGLPARRD